MVDRESTNPEAPSQENAPGDALNKANELTGQMGEIKKQVEEAQHAKEEDIQTRATKVETLYQEIGEISQQIESLKENLSYFKSNEDSLDESGMASMKQTETILATLETHYSELNQASQQLYSEPEVQDEIHRRANEEAKDINIQEVIQDAETEYEPKVGEISRAIESVADNWMRNRNVWDKDQKRYDKLEEDFWSKIKDGVKEKHFPEVERVYRDEADRDFSKFKELVISRAGTFGQAEAFSKVRELSSDLDEILNIEEAFTTYNEQIDGSKEELKKLSDNFIALMEEMDSNVQSKLNKLGSRNDIINKYRGKFEGLIQKQAEKIWASKKRKDPNTIKQGDYNGWHELNNTDPRNQIMYRSMEEISERVDKIVYNKERQQELRR